MNFLWELFTCFHIINKENQSLCALLLSYVLIMCELHFENCPWFIWNIWNYPWFMPKPCEPGAILKCKIAPGSCRFISRLDKNAWKGSCYKYSNHPFLQYFVRIAWKGDPYYRWIKVVLKPVLNLWNVVYSTAELF